MIVGTAAVRQGEADERKRAGRQMAESLEWVIFAYQAVTLLQTAWINPFLPVYRFIILGLAGGHLLLAGYVLASHRLLIGSRPRTAAWLAVAAAVPVTVALMAPHGLYAANPSCVAACTYPAPALLIVALYPWVFGTVLAGSVVGLALITFLLAEWLALLIALGDRMTLTAIQSILVSVMWVTAAFVIGWALRRLTGVWLRNKADLNQQNFDALVNFLHSHIKAGLAAAEREYPDAEGMMAKLRELQAVISKKRLSLLMSADNVPVAQILSEKISLLGGPIQIESPNVGARTVSPRVAGLLARTLGDLLKNAVVHGATSVRIDFSAAAGRVILEVIDDGPGFDARLLDEPAVTLHSLRNSARELGGDLTATSSPDGSRLTLALPE